MLLLRRCPRLARLCSINSHRHPVTPALAPCTASFSSDSDRGSEFRWSRRWTHAVAGLLAGTGAVLAYALHQHKLPSSSTSSSSTSSSSSSSSSLPIFSQDEVSRHRTLQDGVWVTFKGGVYDITEFVAMHPGGDKIMLAAGGAVEPFWALYAVHNQDHVLEILSEYKVGELRAEDQKKQQSLNPSDPFSSDPKRHPVLRINNLKPFNAEPPPEILSESYITPNVFFFKRNHLPVPRIDPESYKLTVEIQGPNRERGGALSLSLDDLKNKFPKHTVTATIQCAGNRRSDMHKAKQVKGLNWGIGAIGNGTWSGAKLRDVLLAAGYSPDDANWARHVQFEGLDQDVAGTTYGASIPLRKAISEDGDCLLAYEMNGEELPLDHGFPIRVIVPGTVGARNVKWLGKIIVSDVESSSHWQQNDYKGFSPSTDWDTVDYKTAPAIQELPIQSAITVPADGAIVDRSDEEVTLKGYAWSGGGREVVRVDVSIDGGKTWKIAQLKSSDKEQTAGATAPPPGQAWAWKLWELTVPLPADTEEMEVVCKAVDSSYNMQPDSILPIWNLRGVLSNAWHRVKVKIQEEQDDQ
ncbi:hypothetical protein NQD34_003579 [Periophthalmus magnuspinnatus]|nr:hypothetical protein NQD34_003579 [Periophthalmus magnuspinnatus]